MTQEQRKIREREIRRLNAVLARWLEHPDRHRPYVQMAIEAVEKRLQEVGQRMYRRSYMAST